MDYGCRRVRSRGPRNCQREMQNSQGIAWPPHLAGTNAKAGQSPPFPPREQRGSPGLQGAAPVRCPGQNRRAKQLLSVRRPRGPSPIAASSPCGSGWSLRGARHLACRRMAAPAAPQGISVRSSQLAHRHAEGPRTPRPPVATPRAAASREGEHREQRPRQRSHDAVWEGTFAAW